MLGLFAGRAGARAFRRHLATEAVRRGADARTVEDALALLGPQEFSTRDACISVSV